MEVCFFVQLCVNRLQLPNLRIAAVRLTKRLCSRWSYWLLLGLLTSSQLVFAAIADAATDGAMAAAAMPTVAFYYGVDPPLSDLQAFDIAVVDPDHVTQPRQHARSVKDGSHELFAYVSLGEVQPSRRYYASLPAGSLRTDNPAWGSKVIDQAAAGWRDFFLDQIIEPLWQQGWRGFFLDTLDSYQLFANTPAARAQQTNAMIAILRELKQRHPDVRLMLNRGFELLPEIAPITFAVAAESLYQGFDAGKNQYRAVSSSDRAWLLAQLQTVRQRYHLPAIAIDYVDPNRPASRTLARATAAQIRADGLIPWVADGGLNSLGIGAIELLPRTVLVLVDNPDLDFHYTEAQRFLGMPLNYLGLRYELLDLKTTPLPDGILAGRYAGVVSWLISGVNHPSLGAWFKQRMAEGVPIAVFDSFGFPIDSQIGPTFGLRQVDVPKAETLAVIARDSALFDFEAPAVPDRNQLESIQLDGSQGRSLLRLRDNAGNLYDAAGLMDWGGFALAPFTVRSVALLGDDRWILQPIKFLQAALRLPQLPVPDVTTEGGQRMLMAHIDADGFASRAELPAAPFAPDVLQRQILTRYPIPTAVSVIEGEISAQGVYKNLAPQLESIAKRIFAMPSVEAASHSYSHPFNWAKAMHLTQSGDEDASKAYGLPLPGYQFDLHREIQGSIDYINTRLMPPQKKAVLFLWSGNCVAPAAAIGETVRAGLLNMNGGDTLITTSNNSWTAIAAQGVRKAGQYQVFAPNQNENVYTNNWNGPFYGYERVLETYRLTETPYRFKPVDIYYHVYSASKSASLAALHKVYDWAVAQPFTQVYPSQYVQKVLDFEATTIARDLSNGDLVVRTGSSLRTLRLWPGTVVPSVARSTGLAGYAPGPAGQYLTLASAQVRLSAHVDTQLPAMVQSVNGGLSDWQRSTIDRVEQTEFTVDANAPVILTLAHAAACSVRADGKSIAAHHAAVGNSQQYRFGDINKGGVTLATRHAVTIRCAR